MLNIGWFSTARGESSRKLLHAAIDHINKSSLNAKISFVFCSREPGESEQTDKFFDLVKSNNLPLISCSIKKYAAMFHAGVGVQDNGEELPEWRLEYDRAVMSQIQDFKVDLIVLAGYMLIIGPEMCNKYNIINLHPAMPNGPKGTWQEVIWHLIEEKAAESGVMMHLVTPELDRGPVITYCKYEITGPKFDKYWHSIKNISVRDIKAKEGETNQLFQKIRQAGFIREIPLVINTLKAFSDENIKINQDKRLIDSHGNYIDGYDLTAEIDRFINGIVL